MEARHRIQEGYLYKKGVYNTAWKKRYFVLYTDRTMCYFKDKSSSAQRKNAKGTIHLTRIEKIELVPSPQSHDNNFQIPLINSPDHIFEYLGTSNDILSSIDYNMSESLAVIKSAAPLTISSSFSAPVRSNSNALCTFAEDEKQNKFESMMNGTKSELQSDRKYSFALVSSSRDWLLCAESIKELKQWALKLYDLTQGDKVYENDKLILFQNKVLKYNGDYIDLINVLFLRLEPQTKCIEIGVSRDKNIKLSGMNVLECYNQIKPLYDDSHSLKYHSLMRKIHIVHQNKVIQNQYVGLYRDYLVIFKDTDQKRFKLFENAIFCNKNSFREYSKLQNYILIPLNANTKIRKASKKHGKHCIFISNACGNIRYYLCVKNEQILNEWMTHLLPKYIPKAPKLPKLRMVKSVGKATSICLLSPIVDNKTNSTTEIIPVFGDFSSAQSAYADSY